MTTQMDDYMLMDNHWYTVMHDFDMRSFLSHYGIFPTPNGTACYRGYILYLEIKENRVYIKNIIVNSSVCPAIEGIEPQVPDLSSSVWQQTPRSSIIKDFPCTYMNINLQTSYTGTMRINDFMKSSFITRMECNQGIITLIEFWSSQKQQWIVVN